MKNRKSVMAFAGLSILLFHLWINMFPGSGAEIFLRQVAFVGVDIFFFLSGYASTRKVENYWSYEWMRCKSVYIKFALFAVAAAIYSGWKPIRLLKVLTGVELFTKGGGAFLWFLPAIMIIYLLLPFFQKADEKKPYLTEGLVLAGWFIIGCLITAFTNYKAIFIFWNRLPIFLMGYYYSKRDLFKKDFESKPRTIFMGALLVVLGNVVLYHLATYKKLQVPMVDMFYVLAIPATIGLVMLLSMIPENKVIKLIGSSTLELYGFQMVFGYKLANWIYKTTKNPVITNLCVIVLCIIAAILIRIAYERIIKLCQKRS